MLLELEGGNFGYKQISNSSEEELIGLSGLTKKELKVLVIRTAEQSIRQVLEDGNSGSEQSNNNSEEELIGLSALIKKELEVLVIRTVEKSIKPILEPMIRRVATEVLDSALEKMLTSTSQYSGNEIRPSEQRSLRLRFLNEVSPHMMTRDKIKGEEGDSIKVDLFDDLTGKVVNSGPLASAKVEIIALKGDFDGDGEDWTLEEFNQEIVTELKGKGSPLTGKTSFNLRQGVGVLDEISLKQNSGWRKRCQLRLGARIVDNTPNGTRVREAKTKRFNVMDRRNRQYKKHFPPSPGDEVWRLKNIRRGGPFHQRLSRERIDTVEDFLREYSLNPQRLQHILSMYDKKWGTIIEHARTCMLDKTMNLDAPPNSQPPIIVEQVVGILSESQIVPMNGLPVTGKAKAQKLAVSAHDHLNAGETSIVEGSSCPPIAENLSNSSQLEISSDFYLDSVEGSSCLPIAEIPSNSSQLEIPSGFINSSPTIDINDFLPPSTPYWGANGLDDYSFYGLENNQSLSLPVPFTNSLFCEPGSSTQAFLSQESFIDLLVNNQNPNLESQGCLQSVVNEAMLKAQRKRTKCSEVLLTFISLKVVALKWIRTAKRPRLC